MRELSLGWATDVAVLVHTGSMVDDRGDHLVIRTPDNPTFHWGNCALVTDRDAVDDAERWVEVFQAAFPAASWVAIGLAQMPRDVSAWLGHDLELELDDVLATRTLSRQTALAPGYTVRRLVGEDWERVVALEMAENGRTAEWDPESYEPFARARVRAYRALSERGTAAFFGAFAEDVLVARLGIVQCGTTARHQSVGTDAQHRRRGHCFPPARRRGTVGRRSRLRALGDRHGGDQSSREYLPEGGLRPGRHECAGLPPPAGFAVAFG